MGTRRNGSERCGAPRAPRFSAILTSLVFLAAGCTRTLVALPPTQSVSPSDEVHPGACSECLPDEPQANPVLAAVEYEPGLFVAPTFLFVIHADGGIEYFGADDVLVPGYCTAQLSPARLEQVRAAIRQAHLETSIDEGLSANDAPLTLVKVPIPDGGLLERGTIAGWGEPPIGRVSQLTQQLDSLTEIERWVGDLIQRGGHPEKLSMARCQKIPSEWAKWFPLIGPPPALSEEKTRAASGSAPSAHEANGSSQ